jgi:hypothetical protein
MANKSLASACLPMSASYTKKNLSCYIAVYTQVDNLPGAKTKKKELVALGYTK